MKALSPVLSVIVTCTAFLCIVYSSCSKRTDSPPVDKCKGVICLNGGTCDGATGQCVCPAGFSGSNCETVVRDKFIGNWTVFEKGSNSSAAQYPLSIQAASGIANVLISNFYNYFTAPISAYVSGDSIHIPNQQYQGKVIFGIGYIWSNNTYGQYGSISMSYEIIDTASLIVDDFGFYPPDLSSPSVWNK